MPRDTLTRDQIVRAAMELLDAEGLEGLNMRALGQRLGSAATAVYWHVGSKENLIGLAGDLAWQEIELPDLSSGDWRTAAVRMATGLYEMAMRHSWLVQAMGSMVVIAPGKFRYDDHNLAVYEAAGFEPERADLAAATVFTFVIGNAVGPAAAAALERKLGRDGLRADAAKAMEIAGRYPRLRSRLVTEAAQHGASPKDTFEYGLGVILDGLAARL